MVKFQTVRQKARIILNSDDAVKTINQNHIIPTKDEIIRFDGSAGTNIDIATDTIHFLNHGFVDNDAVAYTATTVMTCTPAITNNANLFVRVLSEHIFQLATTSGGAPINITGVPGTTAVQTFTRTLTFDGSIGTVVNDANNTITFGTPHRLITGQEIRYDTTGTALTNLTTGRNYFVIRVDDTTIRLAATYADSINTNQDGTPNPIPIDISPGGGTTHNIREIVSVDVNAVSSPIIDLVNDAINIPAHGLNTGDMVLYHSDRDGYGAGNANGTAIPALADNMYYYVIVKDFNSIQLATSRARAISATPIAINLTGVGTGNNHSFQRVYDGPVRVCTNYRFKLDSRPFDLNDKCRLAVQQFDYVKNYKTENNASVGGVYFKNIFPSNTYASQGNQDGTLLLSTHFGKTMSYHNTDSENYSIPLSNSINNILHNDIDIFVDTKKLNFLNKDINGCIDDDSWCLTLVIYELDDFEYVNKELDTSIKNNVNPRLY